MNASNEWLQLRVGQVPRRYALGFPSLADALDAELHVRAAIALSNVAAGGVAYFGVDPSTFEPLGATARAADLRRVIADLACHVKPRSDATAELVAQGFGAVNGPTVLRISVPPTQTPRICFRDSAEGPEFWVPAGRGVRRAPELYDSNAAYSIGLGSPESLVTRFCSVRHVAAGTVPSGLAAPAHEGSLTVGGLHVFGSIAARRAFTGMHVKVERYGIERALVESEQLRPLRSAVWACCATRACAAMRKLAEAWATRRARDVSLRPVVAAALIEAVRNALTHLVVDVGEAAPPGVTVRLFADGFDVRSTGPLPSLFVHADSEGPTARHARNPEIARAMNRVLGEARPIVDLLATLRRAGVQAAFVDGDDHVMVSVSLPALELPERASPQGVAALGLPDTAIGLDDRVRLALGEAPKSTRDVASLVSAPLSSTRAALRRLVDAGIAESTAAHPSSPAQRYRLASVAGSAHVDIHDADFTANFGPLVSAGEPLAGLSL